MRFLLKLIPVSGKHSDPNQERLELLYKIGGQIIICLMIAIFIIGLWTSLKWVIGLFL
jgi:hypothetical protein